MHKENMENENLERRDFIKKGAAAVCCAGVAALIGKVPRAFPRSPASPSGAVKGLVKPARSPWFEKLENRRVKCLLCPKKCELSDGERSPCRVRENRGGEGYTLVFGNPALIQEDPIERKPFFHVLPGSRALSVSTAGCNLDCAFCEVWDMALAEPEELYAYEMPPEKVAGHALSSGLRSVSYAFGEPVAFYEYMAETAALVKKAGLLNLAHSAGFINPEPLKKLCGLLDAANIDLKGFDPAFYRDFVGGELDPVLESLKILKRAGVHLEITNIIIPTLNDDMKLIESMSGWIADELGPDVPLHFSRFYPLYRLSSLPRTPVSTLNAARQTAMKAGLEYVYISRVTGHDGENTYCPGCGKVLIRRVGFVVDSMNIKNDRCPGCGRAVPGRWA